MIKNFETYINEDYFSKLASRKDNGERRIGNQTLLQKWEKEVEWIDMGTDVLWSSINLKLVDYYDDAYECDAESFFDVLLSEEFDDYLEKNGLRLMTKDDILKLGKVSKIYKYNHDDNAVTLVSNKKINYITFPMEFDGYGDTPSADYVVNLENACYRTEFAYYDVWYLEEYTCQHKKMFSEVTFDSLIKRKESRYNKGEICVRLVKPKIKE